MRLSEYLDRLMRTYGVDETLCAIRVYRMLMRMTFRSHADFMTVSPIYVYMYYNYCVNSDECNIVKEFNNMLLFDDEELLDVVAQLGTIVYLIKDITIRNIDSTIMKLMNIIDNVYMFIHPIVIAYVSVRGRGVTVPMILTYKLTNLYSLTYDIVRQRIIDIIVNEIGGEDVNIINIVPSEKTFETYMSKMRELMENGDKYDTYRYI